MPRIATETEFLLSGRLLMAVEHQVVGRIDVDPSDSCGVGMIASLENRSSRKVLELGLSSLANVAHRGAINADGVTGDGSGISTSPPRELIEQWLAEQHVIDVPPVIGIGSLFLPRNAVLRERALDLINEKIVSQGMRVLAVRDVPVNRTVLGVLAASQLPQVVQVFVSGATDDPDELERSLFVARRSIELSPRFCELPGFHVAALSCRTVVYKALVLAGRLADFYPDLRDPAFQCSFCIYHQRFSTNTAPDWALCQPFRMLAHNGEINTIRGNRNWMTARESSFDHVYWEQHRNVIRRLFNFHDSDSASLDNVIELLTLSGRSLPHALTMLVPPAWEADPRISDSQKAFHEFNSCFCEPWDGPAAIVACDGKMATASLDRNGLRPLRFKVTRDQLLIVGSEAGADREATENIQLRGRLGPGQSIAVDLVNQRLLLDHEIKQELANQQPYGKWLIENRSHFVPTEQGAMSSVRSKNETWYLRRQIAAGLTAEEVQPSIMQMACDAKEPTFSMGVDTPLAVLSRQPRHLADYFKQRFAQVTNPPIDPIRERSGISLGTALGPERNLLAETPHHCRVFCLDNPVMTPAEFRQFKADVPYTYQTLDVTWERSSGADGLQKALSLLVEQAQLAVDNQAAVLILSDSAVSESRVAIPMLLAVGAIHHGLCKSSQRMMCSLVAETSDVRDSHQLALLFGFGCTAVYPYLAYGTIERLGGADLLGGREVQQAWNNYRLALNDGLLKIMSKMGVSVLNSYQGAQIFEALGIGPEVIDTCFKYCYANLGGIGFGEIADDCLQRHDSAFKPLPTQLRLQTPGLSKPKRQGEHHVINGKVTKKIHRFVEGNETDDYIGFRNELEDRFPVAVRDLLKLKPGKSMLPIEQVEPIEVIRKRFTTAAMSLGAISPEAHEALAIAMNEIGGKSNSGEGGEDPRRFTVDENGRSSNSRIKQIASGRFGVNPEYLCSADEIEIKMAQGAKPGEGGQLPGFKVNELIARLRSTAPGVTLISPPPHHDIYSIEDLAQLIFDLRVINPRARICVKLVAKSGVGSIALGVVKAQADVVLISGHEGGTGASPMTSIKHAGLPWEIGLAETHQSLVAGELRERVILRADGGLRTGLDVIKAAILGAEEYNFGTMALIALGCVYVKKCHMNNCPVGIATQDPEYRRKFKGKPENLVNYLNAIAQECRTILSVLGVATMDEIIGQTNLLEQTNVFQHKKTRNLELQNILAGQPNKQSGHISTAAKYAMQKTPPVAFDDEIIKRIDWEFPGLKLRKSIVNTDRNIGTGLSGEIVRRFGMHELDDGTIQLHLHGSAGQSLGAFLCQGLAIAIRGEANDFVGKGMAGGMIALSPSVPQANSFQQIIAGNSVLYGATGGSLHAAGQVGERFCVRNSGANAVVEGCGDHGCEYMTRGTAIILGGTGNNFAAGMTGGEAFVLDLEGDFRQLCNQQTVRIMKPSDGALNRMKDLVSEFQVQTQSLWGEEILDRWDYFASKVLHVVPLKLAPEADPPRAPRRSAVLPKMLSSCAKTRQAAPSAKGN